MIILEGPDGCGKTMAVNHLLSRFPELSLGERGTTDRTKLYTVTVPDTFKALGYAVNPSLPPRIWDRLYFSEEIYARVTGRENEFTETQAHWIEGVINATGLTILCMPISVQIGAANAGKTDQMDGVNENYREIWDSYDRLSGRFIFDHHHDYEVDRDFHGLDAVVGDYLDLRTALREGKETK